MKSVFDKYEAQAYPFNFGVTLHIPRIAGATPTDPRVAEGWLKTKLGWDNERLIQEAVAEVMAERGVTIQEATEQVNANRNLVGFKKDDEGLYIEGRIVKAMIKEAANIRWPKRRWGPSNKGTLGFWAEHVFVQEDRIHLGVTEPTGVNQGFVHTFRGAAIKYEEFVDNTKISFTVATDFDFDKEDKETWPLLWLTAQMNGLGGSRSQGNGRFKVIEWTQL